MSDTVLVEITESVAVVVLNRPERRNALNQELLGTLYRRMDAIAADDVVRVVIITGADPSFCSGLDLGVIREENLLDPLGDGTNLPSVFGRCRKPIIGAVNGHAITGGLELALNCDFLIASERASFTDTHVRVGIHPGWGATQLLQQAVGQRRALQMSLSGEPVSAQTAFAWGLVNEVVSHEQLMPRARQVAAEIARGDENMAAAIKTLIEFRNGVHLVQALAAERSGHHAFLKKLKFPQQ